MPTTTMPNTLPGLVAALKGNDVMKAEFERAPMATLEAAAGGIPDNRVYRMVVGALGLGLLLSLVAAAWITIQSDGATEVPGIFITAASTIVGALAGLLAPQPQG